MELNKLIGMLCFAAGKAGVELTAWDAYRLGVALAPELARDTVGTTGEIPAEIQEKEKAREPKIKVYEESTPIFTPSPEAMERLEKKKAQKPATDSKIESVDAPVETPAPEQPKPAALADESKPKAAKKKPDNNALTPQQQQMWDYVQAHPDASVEQICTDLNIKKQAYYNRKSELKKKGYIIPECRPQTQKPAVTDKTDKQKISEKYGKNIIGNLAQIQQDKSRDMDSRMEDAYLGEHPNIQPDPVQRKPVSEKARRLYEYMKSHPDSRMPKTCEDLGICNGDYYMLKAQLKKNGWIESAVENVRAY